MEIKEAILDIELSLVKDFLASFDLRYESDIDKTLYIEENGKIIATVSKAKDIIKCLAISSSHQSENLSSILISKIIEKMHANGRTVNCWTVDNPQEAERLVAMGVDYITTDILE